MVVVSIWWMLLLLLLCAVSYSMAMYTLVEPCTLAPGSWLLLLCSCQHLSGLCAVFTAATGLRTTDGLACCSVSWTPSIYTAGPVSLTVDICSKMLPKLTVWHCMQCGTVYAIVSYCRWLLTSSFTLFCVWTGLLIGSYLTSFEQTLEWAQHFFLFFYCRVASWLSQVVDNTNISLS